jgi:hypothetical protein
MGLTHFFEGVGTQLQDLMWRDVPNRAATAERDRLEELLADATEALQRQRTLLREHSRRTLNHEKRAAWLADRVEIYLRVGDQANAYSHALELDRLRPTLEHERSQFHKLQQACESRRAEAEWLEDRLAEVQCELCR